MKGKFITVEGVEGVGKSTNIGFIQRLLQERGLEVFLTREPGGTPLAEELREILLTKRGEKFNPTAELLVVFAARAQHLQEIILPKLAQGIWVLSDRFTDATYAYQGYGRSLSLELIRQLEIIVQNGLQPDATFYLDIQVELGLARAKARADFDRFEQEELDFFERTRRGYLDRVQQDPSRFMVINAGQELNQVQEDIRLALDKKITGWAA